MPFEKVVRRSPTLRIRSGWGSADVDSGGAAALGLSPKALDPFLIRVIALFLDRRNLGSSLN